MGVDHHDGPPRTLRRRLVVALSVLGACEIATLALQYARLVSGGSQANIVNVAGRQRTIVKEIALGVLSLADARPSESLAGVQRVGQATTDLRAAQHALLKGSVILGVEPVDATEVASALAGLNPAIDAFVQRALALCAISVDLRSAGLAIPQDRAWSFATDADRLGAHINAVVGVIERSINDRTRRGEAMSLLGTLLVGVVATLTGVFVVTPTVRLVQQRWGEVQQEGLRTARLAQIAERTDNAVVVTDPQGQIEWVNQGFTRITGYTLSEVLGRRPGAILQCPRTDRAAIARISAALRSGRGFSEVLLNRGKDGREYWLSIDCQPLLDERGQLTGFMDIESDMTARCEAEQRLKDAHAALEEAQSMASLGSWSLDLQTKAISWSRQTYVLFGRDPALGPPDHDSVLRTYAPPDDAKLDAALKLAISEGEPYTLILRTRAPVNGVRWVRGQGRIERDAEGQVVRVFGTVADVTEAVEREAALRDAQRVAEAANKSKSEFLANMSHEIRTPMTAILGYAELLAGDQGLADSADPRHEYIKTIQRHGAHLLAVINDILDISRIEAGKMTLEHVPVDIGAIVRDVGTLMKVRADEKGIDLVLEFPTALPRAVTGDPTRLRQVLLNLTGNAIKFTQNGRVTVRTTLQPQDAHGAVLPVAIIDTGIGLSAEQQSRLFQSFEQADASVTRRFGGTGLGLRISQRLATMMGGRIGVKSAVGNGSTFTFQLPIGPLTPDMMLQPQCETNAAPVASAPPNPAGQSEIALANDILCGLHILLAEDGPDNQRLISLLLTKAGATVEVVDNGLKALRALCAGGNESAPLIDPPPFDVVIMDMQMPEMDGYTATSLLRGKGCALSIIALTAHAMAHDRDKCLAAGCSHFATKPIDRRGLVAMIAAARAAARPASARAA